MVGTKFFSWLIVNADNNEFNDHRNEENGEGGEEDTGCLGRSDQLAHNLLLLNIKILI